MPFVVTEPCIQCKYTDCVASCPVDCFRDGPNFLVIDPDECIDCGACVPECPVEAIFDAEDVPEQWTEYIDLNKQLATVWPSIRDAVDPLETAEAWKKTEAKDQYLHLDAAAAEALGRTPYGPAPATPPGAADGGSPATPAADAADTTPEPAAAPEPVIAAPPPPAPSARPTPAPARAPTSAPAPASAAPEAEPGMARKVARMVLPSGLRASLKKALGRG